MVDSLAAGDGKFCGGSTLVGRSGKPSLESFFSRSRHRNWRDGHDDFSSLAVGQTFPVVRLTKKKSFAYIKGGFE